MGGKVVQLRQGRELALEGDPPLVMLKKFRDFPEIQVIDLDAALDQGSNDAIVQELAQRAIIRAGGGIRTPDRALDLLDNGVYRVIIGTAAFTPDGINRPFLEALPPERIIVALDSKGGRIVTRGWRKATRYTAEEILSQLEPYCAGFLCTYVDKEGMLQGTDLDWFRRLRAATRHELTAAGGITTLEEVRALTAVGVHAALGMAVYTGRLPLETLAALNRTGAPPGPAG
jgi:phosphoribosylformimino-5-aminoimidazole carboxamide ribonucleotide (ProFAR) isomerase